MTRRAFGARGRPDPVYRFDVFADSAAGGDVQQAHMDLHHKAPDIFYTPCNGGHWMATRFEHVRTIMTSPHIFSSRATNFPPQPPFLSLSLPPQDMDAPEHGAHRLLLMGFLGPKEVRALEAHIRLMMGELIDTVLARGKAQFVGDIAAPLPVRTFMHMMRWDPSGWPRLVRWANAILASDTVWIRLPAYVRMQGYLKRQIRLRRAHPGDDPVSTLLASQIDGRPVSDQRVLEMCNLLFLAGLDTVTNAMTFIAKHLAEAPQIQQRLRADPAQIPGAIEEMLRRYAFVNTARRVTQDIEIGGVMLRKGDTIVASLAAASNDPRETPEPAKLDLDRGRASHLAFNTGPHSCPGASLARMELRIFLEEWLARVPPFSIAPSYKPKARGGPVMALESLPLVW